MGMFDYIKCEMPLPETDVAPRAVLFQTKDTPDQYMTIYTITADGRLSWRPYVMESVPKSERPYPNELDGSLLGLSGCMRRVESEPVFLEDYHGDLFFYSYDQGDWWEYRARFTEGTCAAITLEEFRRSGEAPNAP